MIFTKANSKYLPVLWLLHEHDTETIEIQILLCPLAIALDFYVYASKFF